ncbi:MAG: hypothetical protein ACFBSF_08405 [Leptolyngbyaceae cyanobacterium]
MERNEQTLQILLEEYRALKAEQGSRIGFRDNLLYVTLGLFGGIASFAVSNDQANHAFLVIPWVCIVMGWTYVVNDEKISAIGRYVRDNLEDRISALMGRAADNKYLFGWETAHRDDPRRKSRKYLQLFIDETTFVFSGLTALLVYWLLSQLSDLTILLSAIEAILLIGLGIQIAIYADLAKGH